MLRITKFSLKVLFLSIYLLALFPQAVFAYLDSGSISYVLQFIVAGLLGILVFVKAFMFRIKAFFRRVFPVKSDEKNPGS